MLISESLEIHPGKIRAQDEADWPSTFPARGKCLLPLRKRNVRLVGRKLTALALFSCSVYEDSAVPTNTRVAVSVVRVDISTV